MPEGVDHNRCKGCLGKAFEEGSEKQSVSTTRIASTTFDIWLFALAESFAADFDRLPPTTIPLVSAAPRLDAPYAMNSWLLSSRSPYFRANELAAP